VLWVDIMRRTGFYPHLGNSRKLFAVNYEAGVVIGLPGKPYHVYWFIHRSLTLTDVKLCLFVVCVAFVYTMPLFIALVVFPKKWA